MEQLTDTSKKRFRRNPVLAAFGLGFIAGAAALFCAGFLFLRHNLIVSYDFPGLTADDFDDMLAGPPVQDLWLLLPGSPAESKHELDTILTAYEVFRPFDRASLRLIEPLRAMRMMHFLSWCAVQSGDAGFRRQYPDWGSREFWRRETADFRIQLENIRRALDGKDYSWNR